MKYLLTAVLSVLTASTAWSGQAYFSSDQNVERPIIEAINHAGSSIQAALFEINSKPLIEALQRAAGRGVHVQLLLQRSRTPPDVCNQFLSTMEIHWSGGRSVRGLMHHKFAVFDTDLAVTGSYNWTRGARHDNYENALFEDDADVVKAYMQQFALLWGRSQRSSELCEDIPKKDPSPKKHRRWHSYRSDTF